MDPKDRIWVALDVPTLEDARSLAEKLMDAGLRQVKVGLELIHGAGTPAIIKELSEIGCIVGVDGKLADIPNTMKGAVRSIVSHGGVAWTNLHASIGEESIRKAVEARDGIDILGVTVLTSIDPEECTSIFGDEPHIKVPQFATMLVNCDAQGVICSPKELAYLQDPLFDGLYKLTPGVRPLWAAVGDQKRVMTPGEAIEVGADGLVIGRPITKPEGRTIGEAVESICEEIYLAERKLSIPDGQASPL